MPTTTHDTTEPPTVQDWRHAVLTTAGYPDHLATIIAHDHTIDLHQAEALLEQGCPPPTAAKILL